MLDQTQLLEMTVRITEATVGAAGDKSGVMVITRPDEVSEFIQSVYDRLNAINATMSD